ncbi:MAG: undecaprenyl-diphosphatase, partial [Candidatus Cloacimonetes bacterium]|nr:undecaprenyl-diphosphatase [Candidatus Cloacimonadota bacterium]
SSDMLLFVLGAFAAFVSGFLVISMLIKLIKKRNLKIFSFYCWTISIISIVLYMVQ